MSGRTSARQDEELQLLRRAVKARERQADAMEALVGAVLMHYELQEGSGRWSPESLWKEAVFHGSGGERP